MGRRAVLPLIVIALLVVLGLAMAGCPQPDQSGGGTSAAKPADYETPENWPEPGSVVGYA